MLKTLRNAWAVPEIRSKILFTLLIIVLYRLGASLPIPFIDYSQIEQLASVYSGGSIFAYLNILSGNAFGNATLLALSVSPYITASIVMQLLGVAIPAIEKLSKSGEEGRKKIERITRYVTIGLAIITAFGYYRILRTQVGDGLFYYTGGFGEVFSAIVIIACYTAGAALVMWLAEKIDEQAEGEAAAQDEYEQGFDKFVRHASFGLEVMISKELRDDNQFDDAKQKAINLVQAYKRTRARLATQAITQAVEGTSNISFNSATIDVTCGDNKSLFHSAHDLKSIEGATQANYFSDVLGSNTSVLNKATIKMRNFKDDKGNVLGFVPDTILLPGNDPEYEDFVKRVIGSDGEVGSDHNDINTQRGKWKMVVDPEWTPTISATNHPVILMSSQALKALQGTKFYDRTKLDILSREDEHTRNLTYNGFARMSITFPNWRHVMMLGAGDATMTLDTATSY